MTIGNGYIYMAGMMRTHNGYGQWVLCDDWQWFIYEGAKHIEGMQAMMREEDILWEGVIYWAAKVRDTKTKAYPFEVLRKGFTHSVSLEAYPDPSLAVARAKYLERTIR